MPAPARPKIFHIVHVDKIGAIAAGGHLYSDALLRTQADVGTTIGMSHIKNRRLGLRLTNHPDLSVGACVPFYFCPRSVMLYVINKRSGDLDYRGGQAPIVHLVADLHRAVEWAEANAKRWAFTLSNAGSSYFEDRASLEHLDEIDWDAVRARDWRSCGERKQAEFLVENEFPWELVEEIGVHSHRAGEAVGRAMAGAAHRPSVQVQETWYYSR